MTHAGRLSGLDDGVLDDASMLIAAEGRVSSLDNKTIYHTPAPLAQSTVIKKRLNRNNDDFQVDSFVSSLNGSTSAVAETSNVARFRLSDLSLQQKSSDGSGEPFSRVQRVDSLLSVHGSQSNVSSGNTRSSSLGILQLDYTDTSGGLLNLENSTHDVVDADNSRASGHPTVSLTTSTASSLLSTPSTAIYRPSGRSQLLQHATTSDQRRANESDSDLDASAAPVQITDEQVNQLDADFSDFDFNSTIIDDDGHELSRCFVGNDYDPIHSLDGILLAPSRALYNLDDREFRNIPNAGGGQSRSAYQNSRLPTTQNRLTSSTDREASGSSLDQNNGATRTEGGLDYRYLCKSPSSRVHENGDGEEDRDNRPPRIFNGGVSLFTDTNNTRGSMGEWRGASEMDTDDEIELARQQMILTKERQNTPGASEADEGRPGLVGRNSADEEESRGQVTLNRQDEDNWSVRRNGEGEVNQPVLGDCGGGGGDGESGSDEDRPRFAEQRHMVDSTRYHGNGYRGELVQRVQPVGEDDLEGEGFDQIADGRRESPAPGTDVRSQELFHGSLDSQRTIPGSADMPPPEESQLASRFFNPTSFVLGASQNSTRVTEPRPSWGMNQSSFDLESALLRDDSQVSDQSRLNATGSIPANQQCQDDNVSQTSTNQSRSDGFLSTMTATLTNELTLGSTQSELSQNTLTPSFMRLFDSNQRNGHLTDLEFSPLTGGQVRHKPPIGQDNAKTTDDYGISPVYSDEHGQYVTDLAFKAPFPPLGAAPQPPSGAGGDNAILAATPTQDPHDEDFFSTGEAMHMLSADEKKFKSEMVFHPEDNMGGSNGSNTSNSGGVSSSWSLRSEGTVTRPSWMSDSDEALYMRISIGAFMQGRTEALGTLEGDSNIARPDFGGQPITTPPREREPFPLIQATPNLSDIMETVTEGERSETGPSEKEDLSSHPPSPNKANHSKTREQKYPPLKKNDVTRQSLDLSTMLRLLNVDDKRLTIDDLSNVADTTQDKSGNINISAINRLLTATGPDANPRDLAKMFLKSSSSKTVNEEARTTGPKRSPKKATVSPSKKPPTFSNVKTLKLKRPDENILDTVGESAKRQKSRIPRLVSRSQSLGSESEPSEATNIDSTPSNTMAVTSSMHVCNVMTSMTSGTPMTDLSNQQLSPVREPGDESDFCHVIPTDAPPRTWNTPRPSSAGSRASETKLANMTSPRYKGYSHTDHAEATSGFHSQATEFLSPQMTEQMLPSTPHHSGARRGPRLSSTPMCLAPPGANGTLDDMPSNISSAEKSPQRKSYSDFDNSFEQRWRKQDLPKIREEAHVGSSSSQSTKNNNLQGSNQRGNPTRQESIPSSDPRLSRQSMSSYSFQSLPDQYRTPSMDLMIERRASTGLTSHNETEVFTALPPSANESQTVDFDHRRSLMPGTERPRPAGRAGQDSLPRTSPALGRAGLLGSESCVVCVQAPGEVSFREVCCVGTSRTVAVPVRNPTSRWLQCTIRMVTVNINGLDHEPDQHSPFILRQNLILAPSDAEDVKINFTPRHAGVYVGHLRINVLPIATDDHRSNGAATVTTIPTMITVQGIAEVPNVQVLTDGDRLLDFGHLPWGSRDSLPITIQNAGRATVPVRLTLSGTGAYWRCFSFEPFSESPSDLRRSASRTIVSGHLDGSSDSNTGHGEAQQYTVYLKAPDKTYCRSSQSSAPELLSALVTLELNTNTLKSTLCTLNLNCTAGTAKLRTPADTQVISLSALPSRSDTKIFPLMNAGNIPCRISLEVTDHHSCFSLLPSQVLIEPDGEVEVVVKFTPRGETAPQVMESLLKMFVEPDGPAYELDLHGEIVTATPPSQLRLLSNKHCLAWGGLQVNTTMSQKIVLRNPCPNKQMFRMTVKGSDHFKIQSLQSGIGPLREKDIYIETCQDLPVHIQYQPDSLGPSQGKLNIHTVGYNSRYSVPLYGYGGTSHVVLVDCQDRQKDHYWTSMGTLTAGEARVIRISVRNQGQRAAYVKLMSFSDLECRSSIATDILSVQPSEFVLREKETKCVMLLLNPGERESAICLDKSNIVAAVAVLHGDEIARHKYRKALRAGRGKRSPPVGVRQYLKDVNFDVDYLGQEFAPDHAEFPDTPIDYSLFYSTMSKLVLTVVGEPVDRAERLSGGSNDRAGLSLHLGDRDVRLTDQVDKQLDQVDREKRLNDRTQWLAETRADERGDRHSKRTSPPMKGVTSTTKPVNSISPIAMPELGAGYQDWDVKPEQIILLAPKSLENACKEICLTNYTQQIQTFEFTWPAHYINVTPEHGTIAPRSSCTVKLAVHLKLYSRVIQLPWRGQVFISCAGSTKVLRVQIREENRLEDPGLNVQLGPRERQSGGVVTVLSRDLNFYETVVGARKELKVVISNTDYQDHKWEINTFSMPYLKDPVSGELRRTSQGVFQFSKMAGLIGKQEQGKVTVTFEPHYEGLHCQYWELHSSFDSDEIKINCTGQGISSLSAGLVNGHLTPAAPVLKSSKSARSKERNAKHRVSSSRYSIVVLTESLLYPITNVGSSQTMRVTIKNWSPNTQMIRVVAPEPPFKVQHSSVEIKSRHFLRLPIEFHPLKAGKYKTSVVLLGDNKTLTVQLYGETGP